MLDKFSYLDLYTFFTVPLAYISRNKLPSSKYKYTQVFFARFPCKMFYNLYALSSV